MRQGVTDVKHVIRTNRGREGREIARLGEKQTRWFWNHDKNVSGLMMSTSLLTAPLPSVDAWAILQSCDSPCPICSHRGSTSAEQGKTETETHYCVLLISWCFFAFQKEHPQVSAHPFCQEKNKHSIHEERFPWKKNGNSEWIKNTNKGCAVTLSRTRR